MWFSHEKSLTFSAQNKTIKVCAIAFFVQLDHLSGGCEIEVDKAIKIVFVSFKRWKQFKLSTENKPMFQLSCLLSNILKIENS